MITSLSLLKVNQYHLNILTSWFAIAFGMLIVFFLTPYFISVFGDYKYGIWLLINSVIGYVNLAEAGVNISTGRFVNIHVGKKEYHKASEILSTSILFFVILPCIFVPLIGLLSPSVIDNFLTAGELASDIHSAVILTATTLFVNLIAANIRLPLNVNHRFDLISLIEVLNTLVRTGLILFFLETKDTQTLTYISLATLIAASSTLITSIILSLRFGRKIPISFKSAKYSTFLVIMSFGGWVLLSNIGVMSINYSDNIVISYFLGASEIVYFSIGYMLSKYLISILAKISSVKTPKLTQLVGEQKTNKLASEYNEMHTMMGVFALPAMIVFFLQLESFINLWMGTKYIGSALIGIILTIPFIFSLIMQGIGATLWAKGIVKTLAITKISIAIANLLISIFLVRILDDKLLGVALGTALTSLVETTIILPLLAKFKIGIPYLSIIRIHTMFALFTCFLYLLLTFLYPYSSDTWSALIINSFVLLAISVLIAKYFFKTFKSKLILKILPLDAP